MTFIQLNAERHEQKARLDKLMKWLKSSFLSEIKAEYKRMIDQACVLRQDRGNFAVLCWKGSDGYDEILKAAKRFKSKIKSATVKKDIKASRKKYLEK